jgi:hypothetical protein
MGLMRHAMDWFKSRETPIRALYEDDNGQYAFGIKLGGRPIIVTAKKYLNDGDASFMERKIIDRAIDMDALVLLFTQGDQRLVFDPRTIKTHGTSDATESTARRKRGEAWIDIDADLSVAFEDWINGQQAPHPDDIDRPKDVTD